MFAWIISRLAAFVPKAEIKEYVLVVTEGQPELQNPVTRAMEKSDIIVGEMMDWYYNRHDKDLPDGQYRVKFDPNTWQIISCNPLNDWRPAA